MSEPKPIYVHEGIKRGPVPATEAELLAELAQLSIKVGRYTFALQTIAALTPDWRPSDVQGLELYALEVLKAYNDHKPILSEAEAA